MPGPSAGPTLGPTPADFGSPILLTGPTGFLGVHVLAQLLARGADVVALVRAENADRGTARVCRTALRHGLEIETKRLQVIPGDLTTFASDGRDGVRLSAIRSVFHCAAMVSLAATFAELAPTNLHHTAGLLAWARRNGIGSFDHASTLSVQVCTDREDAEIFEDDDLSSTRWVHGGYAQSKWAAERLVQAAMPGARRHRFGLLTPSRSSCRPLPPERDWLTALVRAIAKLGVAPASLRSAAFDSTPVDHAAAAMVEIARHGDRGAYAICGASIELDALVDALCSHGCAVRWVDDGEWRSRRTSPAAATLAPWSRAALDLALPIPGCNRHQSRSAFLATGRRFDARRRDALLPPPVVDVDMLRRHVASMLDTSEEATP